MLTRVRSEAAKVQPKPGQNTKHLKSTRPEPKRKILESICQDQNHGSGKTVLPDLIQNS